LDERFFAISTQIFNNASKKELTACIMAKLFEKITYICPEAGAGYTTFI
jgi:hypothetical protein